MSRILVTPRSLTASPGDALEPLTSAGFEIVYGPAGRQPSEDELVELVRGCAGWLAGVERISARVIDAGHDLKVISRNGTGIDAIDLDRAKSRGIKVMTAAGANAASVAELAIALMLCGARHILPSAAALKSGEWNRQQGRELGGATIGLVGCGSVGRKVAQVLTALGAHVHAHDVSPDPAFRSPRFSWADRDTVLGSSDMVSLHCPPLAGGAPLIDAAVLTDMRAGVGIVNTARASLVDDEAMLAALDGGHVSFYATDVFEEEPPGATRLVAHPRVIGTPHIGALTHEGGRKAIAVAVDNLLAVLGEARTPAGAEAI